MFAVYGAIFAAFFGAVIARFLARLATAAFGFGAYVFVLCFGRFIAAAFVCSGLRAYVFTFFTGQALCFVLMGAACAVVGGGFCCGGGLRVYADSAENGH